MQHFKILEGQNNPLGATPDDRGVNFALFSAHAEKVELCLFDPKGLHETARVPMFAGADQIWHVFLEGAKVGQVYGYRVYGPYRPLEGKRFNPNKLLFDPYAKQMIGQLIWHKAIFGYNPDSAEADLSFSTLDSAPYVPKSVVADDRAWICPDDERPCVTDTARVIYEMHIKGYTALHPRVADACRGRFSGLQAPSVLRYLRWLGVTSVEMLPAQAFFRDKHGQKRLNYWGYETLNFFTPESAYLRCGDPTEFRQTVRTLHEQGLEVLLDVVYNHTGEGNQLGPTLCYRGIDNESYYVLNRQNKRFYYDSTGCGALFNVQNPHVLMLVTDSLRYWYTHMGVDGFRLDLASSLSRVNTEFSSDSGFLAALRQDPVLRKAKLIAEPWDVGAGGYRIGAFPPAWGEWNDRFRDVARRFWRGDERQVGELASRIAGSSDIFGYHHREISSSVNFMTAHDGFNLTDLVSYDQKHNEANRENNHDGSDQNWSRNSGQEGPSTDKSVCAERLLRRRAMMATLLLSFGTPMLSAGDELGQTHFGNNNPYCQDNVINWIVWEGIGRDDRAFARYVRRLIGLRRSLPVFERKTFFTGLKQTPKGFKDLAWYNELGQEFTSENWAQMHRRALSYLASSGQGLCLVIFNALGRVQKWKLPALKKTKQWTLLVDSSNTLSAETKLGSGQTIDLPAWSVLAISIDL